jgi:UDP-N-acetylmuramoyl-tripeptide--D-alanyl-D-alanine ligase
MAEFTTTEQLYYFFTIAQEVSTDTRKIIPGSIFFALKGGNFNGNSFAKEAIEKGAAAAVIDEPEYFVEGSRMFLVEDALKSLQQLARYHRDLLGKNSGLKVFALTGSNGKTTTKELLARVLSQKFNTLATEGNLNNHIGVPLTLLRLRNEHQMAVIEMGANHQKEIEELCQIADPDYGLITNIGLAHLEGFGGAEGVLKGKTELFVHLQNKNGLALVLADDERVMHISREMNRITYGSSVDSIVRGSFVSAEPFVKFVWQSKDISPREVQTQMVGTYNLPNLIAACAAGFYFGIEPEKIDEAIASYKPSNARSQLEKRGTNTLILDCYNANPSSMIVAIDNLAKMPAAKKIAVLGDMFELGEMTQTEHQRIAEYAVNQLSDTTILLVGAAFLNIQTHSSVIQHIDTDKRKPRNENGAGSGSDLSCFKTKNSQAL